MIMAQYDIHFSCGHTETRQLFGKTKDREWRISEWERSGLCSKCWEAERQRQFDEENAVAMEKAKEYGLPDLTGSEKQIAWATTLRQNWIDRAEKIISVYAESENIDLIQTAMEHIIIKNTSARYWIDSRNDNIYETIADVAEKIKAENMQPPVPKELEEQALEEMAIRPSEPKTNLVTEIRIRETVLSAYLPEKNDCFREIVKDLHLSWEGGVWQRDVDGELKGTPLDRAAELGIKLLAAGFPIRLYQDDLHQRIISGSYEPECNRWVMMHKSGFRIWWDRKEGDFYNDAKRLPGAKWLKEKNSMYVPSEAFREVVGFAEKYQFRFTTKAQAILAKAQEDYKKAMVFDVSAPQKEHLPEPGSVPEKLEIKEFGVDESLCDND
jgi:hypothetical protein